MVYGQPSHQYIMLAVIVSANHRPVTGWHLYQTWWITLYAYLPPFTTGGGGEGGGGIIANKAAKQLTAVWVTPLNIYKETWGYCYLFLWQTKPAIFHKQSDHLHLWSCWPKQLFKAKPWSFPKRKRESPVLTYLWFGRKCLGNIYFADWVNVSKYIYIFLVFTFYDARVLLKDYMNSLCLRG